MNPLEREIREIIASEGPIPLESYMHYALAHPAHGYYMTRDPLGAEGDFTTAPEISQMFGELIGLWAAQLWVAMGAPKKLRLIELGPGRGVLMQDFLRAARVVDGFKAALDLHFVETSPVLAEAQRARLETDGVAVTWHTSLDSVPQGPAIVIANEFFDALPVRHYVKTARGWCERLVGLDAAGEFIFVAADTPEDMIRAPGREGEILEIGAISQQVMKTLANRLEAQGGFALVIDYGHVETSLGETLQAMRGHAYVDPLRAPGEADLTAHVDFAALARAARAGGVQTFGPVPQGEFLLRLGIVERTEALMRKADPRQSAELEAALVRLVSTQREVDLTAGKVSGMGGLFKVLALAQHGLPQPAGFAEDSGET